MSNGADEFGEIVEEEDQRELEPLFEVAPLLKEEEKDSQAGSVLSLRLENCGLRGQTLEVLGESFYSTCLRYLAHPDSLNSSRDSSLNIEAHLPPTESD